MAFLSEARVVWLVHVAPLLGAMLMMANSGSIYLFPVVSSALGARLGFSEAELSTISTLVNAGTWLSVLPGLALDRLGPKPIALAGAALTSLGYALLLAASRAGRGSFLGAFGTVGACGFVLGFGGACTNIAALVTASTNVAPRARALVV